MRICLLADARSVHVHQLAKALCAEGHIVHIVTHKPAPVPGATVERFSVPAAGLRHPYRWSKRMREYLRQFIRGFDVVNLQFLTDWGFRPEEGDWDDGCVVCTAWGSDIFDPPGELPAGPELRERRRIMLRFSSAVTACGRAFAAEVESYGQLESESVMIAPFGVDFELFRPGIEALNSRIGARVGCFKGFRQVYGIPHFIRAMPKIASELAEVEFVLVGDGVQLQECKEIAESLGVARRIRWLRRVPHEMLPTILGEWDVSVMPSLNEAFGVAALESSAMQLPVIASTALGYRDTIRNGITGSVCNLEDPSSFAETVVEVLKNDDLRRKMGAAGRDWVETNFDWRNLSPLWTQVFEAARDRALVMV